MQGAIGIFDSGIGGLATAQAVQALLPNESLIYIADSQFMPYGDKSFDAIVARCCFILDTLISQGAKAVVVACNTATLAAVSYLREHYSIPIIGVEPGVKPAVALTQTGVIGVLATERTLASSAFTDLCARQAGGRKVVYQACYELASAIESLNFNSPYMAQLLQEYSAPLCHQGADVLVLGCTHYTFIRTQLQSVVGEQVHIISTEQAVAQQVVRRLAQAKLLACSTSKTHLHKVHLFTTGEVSKFASQVQVLWPNLGAHAQISHLGKN